jgi:hypothetical protein
MKDQSIEYQTNMYLYDLQNTAREHGFKADDSWELSMLTNTEKAKIQKDYYPSIAAKIAPELLTKIFYAVKGKLNQQLHSKDQENGANVLNEDRNYLVAFNLKRPRG